MDYLMRKSSHRKMRDPMAYIHTHITLAQDQQRDIGIAYRTSLQAMLRGQGTEQTWSTVACMLNIAMILAEEDVLPTCLDTIKQAQQAIVRSRTRAEKFNAWAFDGEGIRNVLAVAVEWRVKRHGIICWQRIGHCCAERCSAMQ
jgi:hypothetical protein